MIWIAWSAAMAAARAKVRRARPASRVVAGAQGIKGHLDERSLLGCVRPCRIGRRARGWGRRATWSVHRSTRPARGGANARAGVFQSAVHELGEQ